ncbi:MAG: permease-like cell division protein FtsX [Tannerellaceae bacterium]|jgi:cell division transport system permease protein|nr:permease-like cell division protein FtsX [Tannerellaceae bacterium]
MKPKKIKAISFFHSRLISIVSIALVLFLLGLIFLIALMGNRLSDYVKENISFSVMLKDDMREAEIKRIQSTLDNMRFTRETEYISKEQAAQELKAELGEDPVLFLGDNPYQASIEVRLRPEYANPDSMQVIERKVRGYASVSEVLYRKDMMQIVNDNMRQLSLALLALAVVLMAISFVLIGNTIRLLIYSKRFLIHTMQLVGATAGFICRPFITHNIVNGIIASFLAIIMLISTLYYIQGELTDIVKMLNVGTLAMVCATVFLMGIILTLLTTIMAVNKYLRMDIDKMYYI